MTDLESQEFEYHAKQLLANPVFISLLENVNVEVNREMDSVKRDDLKTMQALVLLRQASTKIITYIVSAAEAGKVAEFNAKPKRKLFNRA